MAPQSKPVGMVLPPVLVAGAVGVVVAWSTGVFAAVAIAPAKVGVAFALAAVGVADVAAELGVEVAVAVAFDAAWLLGVLDAILVAVAFKACVRSWIRKARMSFHEIPSVGSCAVLALAASPVWRGKSTILTLPLSSPNLSSSSLARGTETVNDWMSPWI